MAPKSGLAGAGFVIYKDSHVLTESSISLGTTVTVYQSELFAIWAACDSLLDLQVSNSSVLFFSDSQAALYELDQHIISSKMVLDVIGILNSLGSNNSVELHWVPGHQGFLGNERADALANIGSNSAPIGPEPFIALGKGHFLKQVEIWIHLLHKRRFEKSSLNQYSKSVLIPLLGDAKYLLLHKNKQSIRILTHILTGHSYLNYFQHKIRNKTTGLCDKCQEEDETTVHFLYKCPAYVMERYRIFGFFTMKTTKNITRIEAKYYLEYLKATHYTSFKFLKQD